MLSIYSLCNYCEADTNNVGKYEASNTIDGVCLSESLCINNEFLLSVFTWKFHTAMLQYVQTRAISFLAVYQKSLKTFKLAIGCLHRESCAVYISCKVACSIFIWWHLFILCGSCFGLLQAINSPLNSRFRSGRYKVWLCDVGCY